MGCHGSGCKVPSWLALADIGVAPYPTLEHFYFSPLKVIEYMAAGLPVAASRIGQIEATLDRGRAGRLVPPGDAASIESVVAVSADEVAHGEVHVPYGVQSWHVRVRTVQIVGLERREERAREVGRA